MLDFFDGFEVDFLLQFLWGRCIGAGPEKKEAGDRERRNAKAGLMHHERLTELLMGFVAAESSPQRLPMG